SGIRFLNNNEFLVSSTAVGTILKYTVGNPVPSVLIDYLAFGLTSNDLLNGVAVGDILRYHPGGAGDFDNNGSYACGDVDSLVSRIVSGAYSDEFDLNDDGSVNARDLATWRVFAGAALTVSGNPILEGDANLDGSVDGSDFGVWNSFKFTSTPAWCSGDFNADGRVDGSDFGIWNAHKFTSSDGSLAVVPEPTIPVCGGMLLAVLCLRRRSWSPVGSLICPNG
ncbi:MAG TPA: dockerin type I domain-containing protein, partial [Pirellulaceae bacterium]